MKFRPKRLALQILFSRRWPRSRALEEGYAILLPTPMDMPFLSRFALEGLRHINTENCKQILIVPDAWGTDGGEALRRVAAQFDDPRIAMAPPRPIDYRLVRILNNSANTHWLSFVNGTAHARCHHAFLHDADAFFMERDGLERQYRECRDRGMYAWGVSASGSSFFQHNGYNHIPGTWELMYSVDWALGHGPFAFKPGWWITPRGGFEFDSMHHPQFLDYASGRIGVMDPPPEFVHFFGVIGAYRVYQERCRRPNSRPIVDQWLRLLLLALLEDLVPDTSGRRALPTVDTLARGLTDPAAPVNYTSVESAHAYPEFRQEIERICRSPIFQGPRADRVQERLRPFDEYYQRRAAEDDSRDPHEKSRPHYIRFGMA
jgi:hypothetical protein